MQTEFWIICCWSFLLVFGSLGLCLAIAAAQVSGQCSDEERKRER